MLNFIFNAAELIEHMLVLWDSLHCIVDSVQLLAGLAQYLCL